MANIFWHVSLKKSKVSFFTLFVTSEDTPKSLFSESVAILTEMMPVCKENFQGEEHTTLAKFHYNSEVSEIVGLKIACHKIFRWVSLISFVLVQMSRVGVPSSSWSELWVHCWSCFRQLDKIKMLTLGNRTALKSTTPTFQRSLNDGKRLESFV